MLKDNLAQVVYILVPAIVDNHLNSKNNAIYSAAIGAIDELIQNLGEFDKEGVLVFLMHALNKRSVLTTYCI